MMMNRSWYLACLVFGSLVLVVHHVSSQDSISESSFSSTPLSTCYYLGVPHLHSEVWDVSECVTCTCTNATSSCVIETCSSRKFGIFCVEPVKPPGDCCYICPYDVRVHKVKPTIQSKRNMTTDGHTTLVLAVDVTFRYTRSTTGVRGESLWELSAWIAPVNPTHSHTIGFTEQVLNGDQASQSYVEGDQFIFRDVVYPFVAPTFNCDEAKVCVELKRGRNAVTARPFRFSSYPQSSTPLIGCVSLCTDRK